MRIKVSLDYVEFTGYEDQCWKFIIGFVGVDFREVQYKDLIDLEGMWTPYGTMSISEVVE